MNCLRCGQKLDKDSTFCDSCLAEMEKFPVASGTAVVLPKPKPIVIPRPVRTRTPEQRIKAQKKTIRFLSIALVVMVALVVLESALILLQSRKTEEVPIGQNYSAETSLPQ